MTRMGYSLASGALLLATFSSLSAETQVPVTLVGHAALPGATFVSAPADAAEALKVSGKFTQGNARNLGDASSGTEMPFAGQPFQGFSGISQIDGNQFYVLTDNGFGSMANSPDAMLFFHVVRTDFGSGEVIVDRTTFLSDPDQVVPFGITMEGSHTRYLTGADFDLEGFQVIDGRIFIGDEFGPYLLVADAETGVVEDFFQTTIDETLIQSPDHFRIRASNPDKPETAANLKRSRGYEGFAASIDQSLLYPLLEGPLWDAEQQDYERVDGNEALRLLEFDVASREWTGESRLYRLEQDGNAIGDFNMIDETRGLVIERDSGQGDAELACKDGETDNCFKNPALFKRVYLIDIDVAPGAPVNKLGYIDLMDIQDPDGVARLGKREDGRFTFPFVTIENFDRYDETHIIVANDNNFPFSMGRDLTESDNNEFILLEASELLELGL